MVLANPAAPNSGTALKWASADDHPLLIDFLDRALSAFSSLLQVVVQVDLQ